VALENRELMRSAGFRVLVDYGNTGKMVTKPGGQDSEMEGVCRSRNNEVVVSCEVSYPA